MARWAEAAVDSPLVSSRDGLRGFPVGRDLGRQEPVQGNYPTMAKGEERGERGERKLKKIKRSEED